MTIEAFATSEIIIISGFLNTFMFHQGPYIVEHQINVQLHGIRDVGREFYLRIKGFKCVPRIPILVPHQHRTGE